MLFLLNYSQPKMTHKPSTALVQYLEDKANEIRVLSIECTNASKSG